MIKKMNSKELLSHAKKLAATERRATAELVESLAEIDRRKLYLEEGFASLWDFATKFLGLSEGSAQRRIQAARLLNDVPEVKASLEQGLLSLSNAAKVQSFRQKESKQGRLPDAPALLQAVESLSQTECEAKLLELSPAAEPTPRREGKRVVSPKKDRELKFVVSAGLFEKLERIKGLIAHAKPNATLAELLEHLADVELKRLEKKMGTSADREAAITAAAAVKPLPAGKRVYIPASLRRAAFAKSGGWCEFAHEGRRCASQRYLQIDHAVPLALGGANTLSNLRVLCGPHNRQQARVKLGEDRTALKPKRKRPTHTEN